MSQYRRELNLDSALVTDSYMRGGSAFTREYIASQPDQLIAIRLRGNINCQLALTSQVPHQVKGGNNQLTMTGHATGDPMESIHFCTMLRVKTDGTVTAADSTLTVREPPTWKKPQMPSGIPRMSPITKCDSAILPTTSTSTTASSCG